MMMTMMHQKPTVDMPPWLSSLQSDPSCYDIFQDQDLDLDLDLKEEDDDFLNSACDEFRMYEFKIRKCAHGRSHDWTECPFAHPGEKARRRDPRKYHYSGTACADFRKGSCRKGDGCELSHGVFELWLHPARYRTQPCKDGIACRRRVCFFAHTPDQLRVLLPQSPKTPLESYDGSPMRMMMSAASSSPPVSPTTPSTGGRRMMNEVVSGMMNLQLGKVKPSIMKGISCGFSSLPSTPTKAVVGGGFVVEEDEDEVVESGRALREKMYERFIRKENDKGPDVDVDVDVDVGWVSELVM